MLEEIGELRDFKSTISKARRMTTFIHRHGRILDAFRKHSNGRDLVRPRATRFATAFLTLRCLHDFRSELRLLFVCNDWTESNLSKTTNGQTVENIVLSTTFWHHVEDCIKASQPLLIALRIVDGDVKPAMPEISAAMDREKNAIKKSLADKPRLQERVLKIIERRWKEQMGKKLHGAALFLNPGNFFDIQKEDIDYASTLREDFNDVLEKMVLDRDLRLKISDQVDEYENTRNSFARDTLIDSRQRKTPLDWWSGYAGRTKELQKFAKRIVSLCCSSSGCERNWCTFEFTHTKRRNRLEWQRLNDLVFIQYNRKIASRFQKMRENGEGFDPLVFDEFKWENEWVSDDPLWEHVDRIVGASNANEGRNVPRGSHDITYNRRRVRGDNNGRCGNSGSTSSRLHDESDSDIDMEDDIPVDDADLEDGYGQPSTRASRGSASGVRNNLNFDDEFL